MSTTYVKYPASAGGGAAIPDWTAPTSWVRPGDWPAEPTVTSLDEKIVMNVAIRNHTQQGVYFTVSGGTFDIDWGDGNTDVGVTGNQTHDYSYASVSGSPTSEGFKVATITITVNTGQIVTFYWTNKATGLVYAGSSPLLEAFLAVPNVTTLDFGASNPTANHYQFKQAKIYNIDALTDGSYMFSDCYGLEHVEFNCDTSGLTAVEWMFQQCYSLQIAPAMDLSGLTGVGAKEMFYNCEALRVVPDYEMPLCQRTQGMFSNCSALRYGPTLTVHPDGVTQATGMYSNCHNLIEAPPIKLGAGGTGGIFTNCYSLTHIDGWDLGAYTNCASMFNGCYSLVRLGVNGFNFPDCTDASYMFGYCRSLEFPDTITLGTGGSNTSLNSTFQFIYGLTEAPAITDTSGVAVWNYAFRSCTSLRSVPVYTTSGATQMFFTFAQCTSLEETPAWDMATITDVSGMFDDCYSLRKLNLTNVTAIVDGAQFFVNTSLEEIPASYDFSNITSNSFSTVVQNTPLREFNAIGPSANFSLANFELDAAALDAMYTALPTVVGKTVTVTGNPGVTGDDPTIATAKGWTVTG